MTAPRRPRSAWLLVGSTPSVWVKVESAGQRLRRFLANWRWYLVLGLLRAACSSMVRSSSWSGAVWIWRRARSPCCLPLAGVGVVVAAPAVGADDRGEALAEQRP